MANGVRVQGNWLTAMAGVSGVLAGLAGPAAMAQNAATDPQISQAAELRTFDIPPQPLQGALILFGQQSGRTIAADGAVVRGVSSPGVRGTMSIDEALRRLLGGTGLTHDGAAGPTITVQKLGASGLPPGVMQLDPVQVQGAFSVPTQAMIDNAPPPYAGGQVATGSQLGLLGNRGVMDTPFNQTSYTAKKVQDQQARTIRDALIDDPSVRLLWPNGGPSADSIAIRGFNVGSQSVSYGGLYGILPQFSIAAELADRIEVLKGPSAMLNGMPPAGLSIGGTINLVPKRAPDEPLTQLTAGYASNAQFGGHVDIARRFGPEKQFGVRFNGVYRNGQTAVQSNTDETGLALLGLDFRGERVRLSADIGYQQQYIGGLVAYPTVAPGVAVPPAPRASNNFGPPWSETGRKDLFGVVRGEVDLTEAITAYAAVGAHDNRNNWLDGGYPYITSVGGMSIQTPSRTSSWNSYLTAEAGIRALVDTGPFNHAFNISAVTLNQQAGYAQNLGTTFASNIFTPTFPWRPNIAFPISNKTSASTLSGIGIADTISAAEKRIQLTVGGRFQRVAAQNFNNLSGVETSSYDQTAFSPSVAMIVKPWEKVSVYGNFIQGLQQGTIVGAQYANAGDVFPPYKSTQYEAGVKVDWGRFTTTLSAFQISQPSAIADPTTNTLGVNGEQRNRGLELNVFGEPTEGVRLLGGAMLIDATLVRTAGGKTDGWAAPGVPSVQLNLGGEWDAPFARGLTLLGRIIYTGSQYIDTTWPRRAIPDWVRFDVGARYALDQVKSPTGGPVVIRFNVENVLDTNYWATAMGSYLTIGAPRIFRLSATFDF